MALILHPTLSSNPARGLLDGRFGKTIAVELPSCPEHFVLEQDWRNGSVLGGVAWHSGYVLAELLLLIRFAHLRAIKAVSEPLPTAGILALESRTLELLDAPGATILEIGAGAAGLPSIVAASLGAETVIATDTGPVLRMLRANLARNLGAMRRIMSQFGKLSGQSSSTVGADTSLAPPLIKDLDWLKASAPMLREWIGNRRDFEGSTASIGGSDGAAAEIETRIGSKHCAVKAAESGTADTGGALAVDAGTRRPGGQSSKTKTSCSASASEGTNHGGTVKASEGASSAAPVSAPTAESAPATSTGIDLLLAADVIYDLKAHPALLHCIAAANARVVVIGYKPRHGDSEDWILDRGIPGLGYELRARWMVRDDPALRGLVEGPFALADATSLGVAVYVRLDVAGGHRGETEVAGTGAVKGAAAQSAGDLPGQTTRLQEAGKASSGAVSGSSTAESPGT